MWFTSAGRLPVEVVTAAEHYRNTIRGGEATTTSSLTRSLSVSLVHVLRVPARMETYGEFMQPFGKFGVEIRVGAKLT